MLNSPFPRRKRGIVFSLSLPFRTGRGRHRFRFIGLFICIAHTRGIRCQTHCFCLSPAVSVFGELGFFRFCVLGKSLNPDT